MTKTIFKEMYYAIVDSVHISDEAMEYFIMDSKVNANGFYFTDVCQEIAESEGFEVIRNVALKEFDDSKELITYIQKHGRKNVIDWSFNFEKPCVLDYVV